MTRRTLFSIPFLAPLLAVCGVKPAPAPSAVVEPLTPNGFLDAVGVPYDGRAIVCDGFWTEEKGYFFGYSPEDLAAAGASYAFPVASMSIKGPFRGDWRKVPIDVANRLELRIGGLLQVGSFQDKLRAASRAAGRSLSDAFRLRDTGR